MAQFIPSLEKIRHFKVQPTEGEWHLLCFLEKNLDDYFEVYFNPFLNGDRPDVIIMRPGGGVMIIEVKDWDLDSYNVDERKHWSLKNPKNAGEANAKLNSPVQQVYKYKENLFELHIPGLMELKIRDIRNFNFVTCAVYFHNAKESEVYNLLVEPFKSDRKYQNFIGYNIDLLGYDSLSKENFDKILRRRYILTNRPSFLFTDEIYKSFKHHLTPTQHQLSEGIAITYNKKQKDLIEDETFTRWRVKGIMGSGKTTVLAEKAVQICKRIIKEGKEPRILILTYNITLKNFIHDKLSNVRADFDWSYFTILNYHHFIGTMMNEIGIPFDMPTQYPNETHKQYMQRVSPYLHANYYNNRSLFDNYKGIIQKYDAILIDEIQDYLRPWMDIVHDNFLIEGGEYYLFGDVKQNVYNREILDKDIQTNIKGRPRELNECFRSGRKIKKFAIDFQNLYFKEKYEIDQIVSEPDSNSLFTDAQTQIGTITYIPLMGDDSIIPIINIIKGNMLNKDNISIHPNDVTILGDNIERLKKIDAFYRYSGLGGTTTMFESYELMFIHNLNFYKNAVDTPLWLNKLFKLIKQDTNPNRKRGNEIIAEFLSRYEFYREYSGVFGAIIEIMCNRNRFSFEDFLKIMTEYELEYQEFRNKVFNSNSDYSKLQESKKIHFYMNTGTIKISTIKSFKGWESEVVFLLLEKKKGRGLSFDEIIYTGLTRTRTNLIVINLGNVEYHENMKRLIETYK